jgi:hypothetical protein
MKIGEWDGLGRARALLQRQLGDLGATELAAHVTVNPDNGRQRILVAADLALLEYQWAPTQADGQGSWMLRGSVYRWQNVHGLRMTTDAQWDEEHQEPKQIWRLVAQEPRIELVADSAGGDRSLAALLAFGRACMERARS